MNLFQFPSLIVLSFLLTCMSSPKLNAPTCTDIVPTGQNRKLYVAACDSAWGPEVIGVYNTTSRILVKNAAASGNLEIINVCANLNWRKLGFLTKPLNYLGFAKKILQKQSSAREDSLIIFSDSDVFWSVDRVDDILQKYDCIRGNTNIVMATESTCWVGRYCTKEDMDTYYSNKKAPGYSAFVNSGLVMGSPAALVEMFSDIVRYNTSALIPKWKGVLKYDDQMAFVQHYHKNQDKITLDYHQNLFGSIVTSHKSTRVHTIPFVCIIQNAASPFDVYDYNCDEQSNRAVRMGVQKLDPKTCKYSRFPNAVKSDPHMYEVYRTLSSNPVMWHGNGAGKRTFLWLRQKISECYASNFGL